MFCLITSQQCSMQHNRLVHATCWRTQLNIELLLCVLTSLGYMLQWLPLTSTSDLHLQQISCMHGTFHLLAVGGISNTYKRSKITLTTKGPVSSCLPRVSGASVQQGRMVLRVWGKNLNCLSVQHVQPSHQTLLDTDDHVSPQGGSMQRGGLKHPCRDLLLWLTEAVAPLYQAAGTCCCHREIKSVATDLP